MSFLNLSYIEQIQEYKLFTDPSFKNKIFPNNISFLYGFFTGVLFLSVVISFQSFLLSSHCGISSSPASTIAFTSIPHFSFITFPNSPALTLTLPFSSLFLVLIVPLFINSNNFHKRIFNSSSSYQDTISPPSIQIQRLFRFCSVSTSSFMYL